MARLIDSMKNRALHIALSRASDPSSISRHAAWLKEGDARFQGRQPVPSTSIQLGKDGKPERVVCAAIQMEAQAVASGIRYVELVYRLAAKAAAVGASIVVFPEYSGLPLVGMLPGIGKMLDSTGSLDDAVSQAGGAGVGVLDVFKLLGPYVERAYKEAFSSVARELEVYIVTGSMVLPDDSPEGELMRATGYVFGPEGELAGRYSKAHLMPIEAEWGVKPASSIPTFNLGGVIVSVPICMDATYFETFRMARFAGADIVAIPSANPEPYNLWYALRGIWPRVQESQVYGIGASMVGRFAGWEFTGRSALLAPLELSPGGDGILAQTMTSNEEDVVFAEFNLPLLHRLRAEDPLRFNLSLYRKYLPSLYRSAQSSRSAQIVQTTEDGTKGEN
ncbi:MAG: nitrilase [Firmicutes bacterium]|nr:nitrilase [Bacillota bacterium]